MKNNLKKKKQNKSKNINKTITIYRGNASPASIILTLIQKSSQSSQRYKYAMLTNSACSIAITFFLVVNFWKVEGYQPKRKFSLTIKACLFLLFALVETIMKDLKTLNQTNINLFIGTDSFDNSLISQSHVSKSRIKIYHQGHQPVVIYCFPESTVNKKV